MRFRGHKYEWTRPYSAQQHTWSFRGPDGGIHLHVSLMDDRDQFPDPSCGLEFHHATDPSNGGYAPSHKDCWLIGGRCWHDGTSMYARETVWPAVEGMMPDHDAIFRYLERIYTDHFDKSEDES